MKDLKEANSQADLQFDGLIEISSELQRSCEQYINHTEITLSSRRDFLQQATVFTASGFVGTMLSPLRASAAFIGFWKKKSTSQAGTLWVWGEGTNGQLGNGAASTKSSPIQVGALNNWSKVASGASYSLAIKSDGSLWAWELIPTDNWVMARSSLKVRQYRLVL